MVSREGCPSTSSAQVQQKVTPSPMEAVLKELAELRSVNQKLNDRLDAMCKSKAKKSLFSSKQRSSTSVDPSCSVSTEL